MPRLSLLAFWFSAACIVGAAFFCYPKWEKRDAEATIGWDVSGYYLYLPAAFIYHDLKNVAFLDSILEKYHPTPGPSQGLRHPSGGFVLKYSLGQALQFLPWFAAAHLLAEPLGYPADGFSKPYQAAVSWGSLLVALLGLWFARRNLLGYFSDRNVAVVLLCLVLGTNYLNYTAYDGAMTHNWLFTAYSLLIFSTIRFYRRPSFGWAALIGLLLGWMALTRPTEIVAALIPLLWGLGSRDALRERMVLFRVHFTKIIVAALVCAAVGFLQLAYWKYVAGEWIVYSYAEQGFYWSRPHVINVMFSYRAGWLMYTPMMGFAVLGLAALWRQQPALFPGILAFCGLFLYITSAWDIWWYGGSLGMRAMVQSYAVWVFPLAAFVQWMLARTWGKIAFALLAGVFVWLNLWWTNQAHRDKGFFVSEQMTKAFFWKVLGRNEAPRDVYKFLDTREEFRGGERRNVREIYRNDFENDTLGITADAPISGAKSLIVNREKQFSPEMNLPLPPDTRGWLRTTLRFRCEPKEWERWRMTQCVVRFSKDGKSVKDNMIRLQRLVDGDETQTASFDTEIPGQPWDKAFVFFWNADSDKTVRIDELCVEFFD